MNNNENPWWLPPGSIRAALAVMVIGSLCYAFLKAIEVPDRLWDLGLLVLGAYFVQKVIATLKK
ncbi:hypothetical protein LCGC14_0407030 [marine sediment metagenome]|uniref:Uncharacterized protein n=1 Tax=marine sediment metagenome TaxID=412755 RepID=A0A0F9W498_9ZZZZ